jgi:hypothetical protein
MSMPITRTAITPVWLLVFWLLVVSRSPMTFATGVGLLLVGGLALTTVLVLRRERPTLPAPRYVPNPWPNSAFRNSRQRGTRGR